MSPGSTPGPDLTGRLLVASPRQLGPTFERSVVLLLDHNDDTGSLGVVINRPMRAAVGAILPQWQDLTSAPGRVHDGGPVGKDSALGIASVPGDSPKPAGVRRISGALGLVDLDADPDTFRGQIAGLRIFVGYAGWGPGQLRDELDDESWFVVDMQAGDGFTPAPESLWETVLTRQGGDLALVARYPADPELN